MCDMSQTNLRRNATISFINSTGNSILQSTRRGISSRNSFLQTMQGRIRSYLPLTSSPTRPNEATSDADELSKIRGRLQVTRLPRSDTKLENMIVGRTSHATREIPANTMSIEQAKAIKFKHNHPKHSPPRRTSGLSDEDSASIEDAKNIIVEEIISFEE